jgi:hypothetical protein
MKMRLDCGGKILLLLTLAVTPLLTGCGNFWEAPSSTGTTASTTTLSLSASSVTAGTSVTLTATMDPTAATGTITFYNGSTELGTATLSSGSATYTYTPAAGTYTLKAVYGGDDTYETSTSSTVSLTVTAVGTTATTTTLTAATDSPVENADVKLTATLSSTAATGTVTFYDSTTATTLGTGTLSSGVTTLTTTFSTTGTHALTATYGGDTTYASSVGSLSIDVSSSTAATTCGYQDSTNSVDATAVDSYLSGSNGLAGASLSVTTADESAVCVTNSGTTATVTSSTITSSSAGSNSTDSSYYGTDAALLAYGSNTSATSTGSNSGGTITMTDGSITTSGEYGSGAFAYGYGSTISLSGVTVKTTGAGAFGVDATEAGEVTLYGGSVNASDAEAVVVEGTGAVTLSGPALTSAGGDNRGVLLYGGGTASTTNTTSFTMSNGSLKYTCDATETTACASAATTLQSNPATVFAVANTTATITLTDVTVTNDTPTSSDSYGTLLTAAALNSGTWGTSGSNGGKVTFIAYGESLTGDVIVDANSTVALTLNEDSATPAVGSMLTGAINNADSASTSVTLTLDANSKWIVTGDSYLTSLTDADTTYANISCKTTCSVYVNGSPITLP